MVSSPLDLHPSMFNRISRRCLSTVSDSKTLLALCRYCLTVVQFPGLISFLLLCILQPPFHRSGAYYSCHYSWCPRLHSSISYGSPCITWYLRGSDANTPYLHLSKIRHPFAFVWSPRFIIWFAISCTSLWVGLHYQQPSDRQYLSLIDKGDAHPKRAGYANQGRFY